MPDPLPSAENIAWSSQSCKLIFQLVVSEQWDAQFTNSNALRASFADIFGRYKIWGGSIGVFQDHDNLASLAQRLRDAARVAGQILELLSSLEKDVFD
ncbi:hypothetical protein LTR66_000302, partial [Elasticomyces elasticus]